MINAFDLKAGFTNAFSNLDPKTNGLKIAWDKVENNMQKVDPNKSGISNAFNNSFDPTKNGLVNTLDPKKLKLKLIKS